ncbi:DNA-binding transcriptional regulator [Blastopirellula sp. J2-11]|uniref:AraC family transcriptional regulator n=1 Tax=Blastopirellula sp. J2-11 TaxID=2943192 RepID=UPI0021CA7709|nr:DNA-binding transcriptional regulator [Blastopirellula sp. J2-11]UUO04374.1 DNA-binding transcriptional regulator [Blastopirellula sp. J2-11]
MSPPQRVAIIPDFAERYDRSVIDGISRYVHQESKWSLYVPADIEHRDAQLMRWKGDGIIANFDDPKIVDIVRHKNLPSIGFGGGAGYSNSKIVYMATGDEAIGRMGAEHFLERGYSQFAFAAMPLTRRDQPWSERRAQAFAQRVAEEGYQTRKFRPSLSVARDWDQLLGALGQWIEELPKPIGLMAAYDTFAFHVLEACREREIQVPEDVAVLGVDNEEHICELSTPQLSSIIQGGATLGYRAAEMLDQMMQGKIKKTPKVIHLPPVGIVTRRSTDILAIRDKDVARALQFIRENACHGIQVPDVVRQVSLSRVTLENRFRELIGRTMHREIKRIQLDKVKELLRTTDLPMQMVASQSGFEYPEYLSNFFSRETGRTLGQYRSESRD